MTQPNNYPHLVTWFEIPATDLDRAARLYSEVLGVPMKVEQFGSERLSVFPHQKPAVGGEIVVPRTALPPGMGFYARIRDTEGNVVGLHALA